jgi:Domain of unknown function (DUF4271)
LQKTFCLVKKIFVFLYCIIFVPVLPGAQKPGSTLAVRDSLQIPVIPVAINQYSQATQTILNYNKFLNSRGTPIAMAVKPKKINSIDGLFYLIAALVLLMGIIRFFFAHYFTNLFRVFFNTSLRQSQLTDQLLQAKLPSLFFNLFFIVSAGTYAYFILWHYGFINGPHKWLLLGACILCLSCIYMAKYSALKFTGWVTGYKPSTDTYIFIIFLINKIIGVLLVPFIVLIALAQLPIANACALISLLVVVFLLLLRFFRSYGLLQSQLKVSQFHFFLYIAGVEIIPLLLLYKGLLILLGKNL